MKTVKSTPRINIEDLVAAMQVMGPHSSLFKAIRSEMKRRGRWKNAPRGRAFTGANTIISRNGPQKRINNPELAEEAANIKLPPKDTMVSESDFGDW